MAAQASWSGADLSPQDIWPTRTAATAWSGEDLSPQDLWPSASAAASPPRAQPREMAAQASWSGADLSPQDIWPTLTAATAWSGEDLSPQDLWPSASAAPAPHPRGGRPVELDWSPSASLVSQAADRRPQHIFFMPLGSEDDREVWYGEALWPQDIWPASTAYPVEAKPLKKPTQLELPLSSPSSAQRQKLRVTLTMPHSERLEQHRSANYGQPSPHLFFDFIDSVPGVATSHGHA